jgi:hypothetical protein
MANNGTNGTKKRGAQLQSEIDEVLQMRQKKAAAAKRPGKAPSHPSQADYERRELTEAQSKLNELRRAPLSDRKEAQAEFLKAMRDNPELVEERIGWLLGGSYGYGPMVLAKRVLGNTRMNRSAALTQMIGAFEWMTPGDMAIAAWKKLSAGEKAALERAVQGAIKSAQREE